MKGRATRSGTGPAPWEDKPTRSEAHEGVEKLPVRGKEPMMLATLKAVLKQVGKSSLYM